MGRFTDVDRMASIYSEVLQTLSNSEKTYWPVAALAKSTGITHAQMTYFLRSPFNDLLIQEEVYGPWTRKERQTKEQLFNRHFKGLDKADKNKVKRMLLYKEEIEEEQQKAEQRLAEIRVQRENINREEPKLQDYLVILDLYHKEAITDTED